MTVEQLKSIAIEAVRGSCGLDDGREAHPADVGSIRIAINAELDRVREQIPAVDSDVPDEWLTR